MYYLPSGASVETDAGSIEAELAESRKISTQLSGSRHSIKISCGNRLDAAKTLIGSVKERFAAAIVDMGQTHWTAATGAKLVLD